MNDINFDSYLNADMQPDVKNVVRTELPAINAESQCGDYSYQTNMQKAIVLEDITVFAEPIKQQAIGLLGSNAPITYKKGDIVFSKKIPSTIDGGGAMVLTEDSAQFLMGDKLKFAEPEKYEVTEAFMSGYPHDLSCPYPPKPQVKQMRQPKQFNIGDVIEITEKLDYKGNELFICKSGFNIPKDKVKLVETKSAQVLPAALTETKTTSQKYFTFRNVAGVAVLALICFFVYKNVKK